MNSEQQPNIWRRCTTCKKPIALGQKYWVCSVSTCTRIRAGFYFCTLECWDAHVPVMNHKNAWAEERVAPTTNDANTPVSPKKVVTPESEILVVASKVRAYIHAKSGFNTSGDVYESLSDFVRQFADQAMERAKQAGRQTVMDRDF